ncbi:MAG: phosphatidylglycerophosphatase A [Candidatus Neomarinimicrobiota bacterium]
MGTFGGVGYLRPGPGTWGSLTAAVLWWFLVPQVLWIQLLLIVALTGAGLWAAGHIEQLTADTDPGHIVIDEVAGQWLALVGCGPVLWQYATGFILFRLLDIFKPGPISRAQALPRGWGVMADDLLAGALTLLILSAVRWTI